jgi:hypothetical protein
MRMFRSDEDLPENKPGTFSNLVCKTISFFKNLDLF